VVLGLGLAAGPDLDEVGVVGERLARDVDDGALAALALPVSKLDLVEVLELVVDDDRDALVLLPLLVGVGRLPELYIVWDCRFSQI
jgi:hypothetical protein